MTYVPPEGYSDRFSDGPVDPDDPAMPSLLVDGARSLCPLSSGSASDSGRDVLPPTPPRLAEYQPHDARRCGICKRGAKDASTAVRGTASRLARPAWVAGIDFWRAGDPKSTLREVLMLLQARAPYFHQKLLEYLDELQSSERLDRRETDRIASEMRAEAVALLKEMFPHATVHEVLGGVLLMGRDPAPPASVVSSLAELEQRLSSILAQWTCHV